MYNYYYLLYKINTSPLLWIVDESINYDELYDNIHNFFSTKENYIIVKKLYTKQEIKLLYSTDFKRFQNFKIDKQCELMFITN